MIETYGPLIVGTAMIIGGVALLLSVYRRTRQSREASTTWAMTRGTVLRSAYRRFSLGSTTDRNPKSNSYMLEFEYAYTAAGTRHVSERPLFFSMHTLGEIEPFLARYPEGAEVQVHYDPQHPADAVIETETRGRQSTTIAMAFLLMLVGFLQLWLRADVLLG